MVAEERLIVNIMVKTKTIYSKTYYVHVKTYQRYYISRVSSRGPADAVGVAVLSQQGLLVQIFTYYNYMCYSYDAFYVFLTFSSNSCMCVPNGLQRCVVLSVAGSPNRRNYILAPQQQKKVVKNYSFNVFFLYCSIKFRTKMQNI